jgi:membrane-bound lytic murein transglycosylase D
MTEPLSGISGARDEDPLTAASPSEVQPDLAADPVDYSVAADGTIEIQIAETLGHYAEWLGTSSDRLRRLNDLGQQGPLIVGRRLKLEFSHATRKRFLQQRIAFHKSRQLAYFRRHRISGVVEHRVKEGDNLWLLAVQQYEIPLWLLRQYNPDIRVDSVLSLDGVVVVPLVRALPSAHGCPSRERHSEAESRTDESALRTQAPVRIDRKGERSGVM